MTWALSWKTLIALGGASFSAGLFGWLFTTVLISRLFARRPGLSWRPLKLNLSNRFTSWKRKLDSRNKIVKMREVFPQTLGMTVQALKTGQTVPQVLEYVSREGPSPLREEWVMVCSEMSLGLSAEEALFNMTQRFSEFSELFPFLESYRISRQTGANLTQLWQALLDGIEEKNRILRKMEAMTAQARLSGLLMGILPVLLAAVFFFMDPSLMAPLFTEKAGWAILLTAFFLETLGFLWIRQLLRLEV